MRIWIDGDACPKPIKTILFRAAIRTKTHTVIVANHFLSIPESSYIKRLIVPAGFDVADNSILQQVQANDLVITADIPLADKVVLKAAVALNPRGILYTTENIKQFLSIRNLNESLRNSGLISGGAGKISAKEVQLFSNRLDWILTKQARGS